MPTYEYVCPECGLRADAFREITYRDQSPSCPNDKTYMQRVFSSQVNFARSSVRTDYEMSPVTGQLVRNPKDLEGQIKRMNDEKGTHYVLSDPTDAAGHGVTDEGLDATERANTDSGKRTPTLWL